MVTVSSLFITENLFLIVSFLCIIVLLDAIHHQCFISTLESWFIITYVIVHKFFKVTLLFINIVIIYILSWFLSLNCVCVYMSSQKISFLIFKALTTWVHPPFSGSLYFIPFHLFCARERCFPVLFFSLEPK